MEKNKSDIIMKNKKTNELSMFFVTMPMTAFNIFAIVMYELNVFLQLNLYFVRLYKGNEVVSSVFYACIWEVGTFVFLLRLFYGKTIPKIKMCLPYTKKLFTFDICVFVEAIGMLKIIFVVLMIIIYSNKGVALGKMLPVAFIICVVQFFISVFVPVEQKYVMNETYNAGFVSISQSPLNIFKMIASMGIVLLPLLGLYLFRMQVFSFVSGWSLGFAAVICVVILSVSFFVNYLLFLRNYNRR